MGAAKIISILFLIALIACNCCSAGFEAKAPLWSNVYTVKGVLNIPYAEISEPFQAWYDEPSKLSRIDYYGDMVKTYQLSTSGPYGTSIKIAPVTTEIKENVKTCLQVNGTKNNTIKPQAILPDLENFELIGNETIKDILTEKWRLSPNIGPKMNIYTIWLYYKSDPNNCKVKIAIPVRYEMRGINTVLGSHYDHYFLDYESYDVNPISKKIFQVDPKLTCRAFSNPGNMQIYTFNPMAEFIYPEQTSHVDFEFDKFINKHKKQYKNDTEQTMRKEIFRQNIRFIHSVNRQYKGFTLAVNHLADKTPTELKAYRGKTYSGVYNGGAPFPYSNPSMYSLPDQFDWRLYGAVAPVKDQAICGSSWSFGAIGAIEGAYFLKNSRQLFKFSQQALIDCSWGYGNNGCDGGEDFRAFQWILKHGGVPTEVDYGPYLGQDGYCHSDKVPKIATITGYVNVTANNEVALRLAITKRGPISVAIDASQRSFSFYSNGIYYSPECGNKEENLNHAVLAVGYGTLYGKNYWLIKNSWSNHWGNDGYVLMATKDNNCGVMTTPIYVTM